MRKEPRCVLRSLSTKSLRSVYLFRNFHLAREKINKKRTWKNKTKDTKIMLGWMRGWRTDS